MLRPRRGERALPSRSNLNLRVEKERCCDWNNILDSLLAAVTDPRLESWRAEVAEIALSLNEAPKSNRDAVAEERSKIQREIERLQRQMAVLENGG